MFQRNQAFWNRLFGRVRRASSRVPLSRNRRVFLEGLEDRRVLAPGDLDLSFGGGDGIVTTAIGTGNNGAYSVAVDSAGKYAVAGSSWNGTNIDFALTRYTSAGVLDSTFGGGDGIVTTAIGTANDEAFSVAVDSAGKYVLAGTSYVGAIANFALARYTPTGVLDTTFGGGDGIVTMAIGIIDDDAFGLAVDSVGNYVVAGHSYGANYDFALTRFTSAGVLDTTFGGGDGIVTTAIGAGADNAYDLAVDSAGNYVLAGTYDAGMSYGFALARYTSTGVLDTTFGGGDGIVTTLIIDGCEGTSLAVDSAGKYVVAGWASFGGYPELTLLRYTSTGVLDTSFGGGDGIVTASIGTQAFGTSVAVDGAGNYIVGGYSVSGANSDFALTRFTSVGVLDATFGGGDGIVKTAIGTGNEQGLGVAVDSTGNYVVAGFAQFGGVEDFALVRYEGLGLLAVLDGSGNLTVTDASGTGKNNQLSISTVGGNLIIADTIEQFISVPAGWTMGPGNTSIRRPLAGFTGSITVNSALGNDTLTVNLAGGDVIPNGNIIFNGGSPTTGTGDKLVITGGSQGTVTYNYLNAHDGDVVMSNFGTVTYTGLEPITNSGTATDVIFNLPAVTNAVTLGDDGTSGNGLSRLSASTFETTDFSNPTNSLTINRGSGADTLVVNALPELTSTVILGGGTTPLSTITLNGAITLAANRSLAVFAAGTISLPNAASDVTTTGTGAISLTSNRNILLSNGSSLVAVNGGITLSANMQTPATTFTTKGIELVSAEVRTTGSGSVTVEGRSGSAVSGSNHHGVHVNGTGALITSGGGNVRVTGFGGGIGSAFFSNGVTVSGGGEISAGGTGTTTVEGTGGNLTGSGSWNHGVQTIDANSRITSASGNVVVTGTGGGSTTGTGAYGVSVETNSTIFAGGATATTTITGFGGGLGGGGFQTYGVYIGGGTVTSSGGNVIVTGTGGGSGTSSNNIGVTISSGGITAGGMGTVTVTGLGGTASGGTNCGIFLFGGSIDSGGGDVILNGTARGSATSDNEYGVALGGGLITVGGNGTITINGTGGSGSGTRNYGFYAQASPSILRGGAGGVTINAFGLNTAVPAALIGNNVAISTLSTGNITIAADRFSIGTSTITVGANSVTLKPTSSGQTIDLGGNDSPTVLGLSDAELDRITAGTLVIGDFNLAPINVTSTITRSSATNVFVNAGNALTFAGGSIVTSGGTLQLASSGTPGVGTRPNTFGVDVTASTTSLLANTPLEINISGPTVDANYQQLNVAGSVNLNNSTLILTGSYVPTPADQFVIVNNDGTDPITGTFAGLAENAIVSINGSLKRITYVGGSGNDVVLTVVPNTLFVTSFSPTTTGAVLNFNRDLDASTLNLYDLEGGTFGPADVTLVGATVGAVRGSIVMDPNLRRLTFVATEGVLPPDSYTLTLRSAANGFVDTMATLLDGNANGTVGDNYVNVFTVTAPPPNAITLRVANFARGPQQAVNIPANGSSGLPISFSNGGGITSANFSLLYNPALLNITGATVAPGLTGATVNINTSTPGVAVIQFSSPTPLAAGTTRFIDLAADVPTTAPYRTKHVLDFTNISFNTGLIPAVDDDALHIAAYFGDTTGNGLYSATDASRISRVAVAFDTGFQLYQMLDPLIIGDISGAAGISSTDASRMLQASVGFPVAEIPLLPLPAVSLVAGGPDPKLSIPTDLIATAGGELIVPVHIDSIVDLTGTGLESADLVIYYDASVLEVTSASLGSLVADQGNWIIASRIDALSGRIFVSLAGNVPLEGFFQGELVQLHATVKASAPVGPTAINLAATARNTAHYTQLNEGYLTLIPAPTDAANDPGVDGLLTVLAAASDASLTASAVRIVDDRLWIVGTRGDDRIIVAALANDQVRVRMGNRLLGDFPRPSGLGIDGLAGHDFIYVDSALPATVIAADSDPNDPIDDLIFAAGNSRLAEASLPAVSPSEHATAPLSNFDARAARDMALLQMLADWSQQVGAQDDPTSLRITRARRR